MINEYNDMLRGEQKRMRDLLGHDVNKEVTRLTDILALMNVDISVQRKMLEEQLDHFRNLQDQHMMLQKQMTMLVDTMKLTMQTLGVENNENVIKFPDSGWDGNGSPVS